MTPDKKEQQGAPERNLDPKDKKTLAEEMEQQSFEESPPDIIIEN